MATGRIPINGTAAIQSTIVDAKGDLIAGTGSDAVARLAVGANGTTLVADSAETTGLKWAAPAAGGGENWTLLNSGGTALTGSQTVTVSGISGKERILVIIDTGSSASASSHLSLRINGDTGNNYNIFGGLVRRDATFGNGSINRWDENNNSFFTGPLMANAEGSAGAVGFMISGCNSSGVKTIEMNGGCDAGGGTGQYFMAAKGWWNNSATVTSVSAYSSVGNWDNGTLFVYATA